MTIETISLLALVLILSLIVFFVIKHQLQGQLKKQKSFLQKDLYNLKSELEATQEEYKQAIKELRLTQDILAEQLTKLQQQLLMERDERTERLDQSSQQLHQIVNKQQLQAKVIDTLAAISNEAPVSTLPDKPSQQLDLAHLPQQLDTIMEIMDHVQEIEQALAKLNS